MQRTKQWQRHLHVLLDASLGPATDPMIHAAHWGQDPRRQQWAHDERAATFETLKGLAAAVAAGPLMPQGR